MKTCKIEPQNIVLVVAATVFVLFEVTQGERFYQTVQLFDGERALPSHDTSVYQIIQLQENQENQKKRSPPSWAPANGYRAKFNTSAPDWNNADYAMFICTDNGLATVTCESSCIHGTGTLNCDGDPIYCQNYRCTRNAICFCQAVLVVDEIRGWNGSNFVAVIEQFINKTYPEFPDFVPLRASKKREFGDPIHPLIDAGVQLFASLDHHDLVIITNPITPGMLSMSKGGWYNSSFIGGQIRYPLPDFLWVTSGRLSVTYIVNGSFLEQRSLWIVGEKFCHFKDCLFCWDSFNNFQCLTWGQKVTFIILLGCLLLFILAFMPIVVWLAYWSVSLVVLFIKTPVVVVKAIFQSPFISDVWGFCKWIFNKRKYFYKVEKPESPRMLAEQGQVRKSKHAVRLGYFMLLGLLGVAQACDAGIFQQATFTNCVRNGTIETCNVAFQLTFSLQTQGTQVCIGLMNGTEPLGTFLVTYSERIDRISLTQLYITSGWTGHSESDRECCNEGGCSGNCESTYVKPNVPKLNQPEVENYPGFAGCRRGCGCASCDCFFCCESCIYSGYGIVPDGNFHGVAEFGQRFQNPMVNIRFESTAIPAWDINLSFSGQSMEREGFRFTIIGSLVGDTPDFADRKFIWKDHNNAWIGFASDPNSPAVGGVGDIQAPTTEQLMTASPNAFLIPADIATKAEHSQRDEWLFASNGLPAVNNYPKLPTMFNGQFWFWDGVTELLTASISNPGALLMTMETTASVKINRIVNVVCPRFFIDSIGGCYQCSQGFMIQITAWSVCLPGTVTVTENAALIQLGTPTLAIDLEHKQYNISGMTTSEHNRFFLTLTGNGDEYSQETSFTAVFVPVVNTTDNCTTVFCPGNSTADTGSSGSFDIGDIIKDPIDAIGNFFDDLGTGKLSWYFYLAFVAFVVVAGFIVFLATLPIIYSNLGSISTVVKLGTEALKAKFGKSKSKLL